MIEPYQVLTDRIGFYVQPAKSTHVGPASIDICLGQKIMCTRRPTWVRRAYTYYHIMRYGMLPKQRWDTSYYDEGQEVFFDPAYFYLCTTVEYIRIPHDHAGQLLMRSSKARQGFSHNMAAYFDPGFHGEGTMELTTAIFASARVGERIAQLVMHRLSEPTTRPYRGRYNGQRGPTVAYAEENAS